MMSDKNGGHGVFDGENPSEQALWKTLGDLPQAEPSADMRRAFHSRLQNAYRMPLHRRLQALLGLSSNVGWVTAAACLLLGIGAGQLVIRTDDASADRLAALESNVAMLNRSLILDRLQNDSASKRLQGVLDAAYAAESDTEIARALLQRATEDRAPLVRTAAIDALGPHFNSMSIRKPLMELLRDTDSPLVQLALVDLVLRNGDRQQFDQLLALTEDGALHEDVAKHVLTSLARDVI